MNIVRMLLTIFDLVVLAFCMATFIVVPILALRESKKSLSEKSWRIVEAYFLLGLLLSVIFVPFDYRAIALSIMFLFSILSRLSRSYKLLGITVSFYIFALFQIVPNLRRENILPFLPENEKAFSHRFLTDTMRSDFTKELIRKTDFHKQMRFEKPMISRIPVFPTSIRYRIIDSWGQTVSYQPSLDRTSYKLISFGPDQIEGTTDDIVFNFR